MSIKWDFWSKTKLKIKWGEGHRPAGNPLGPATVFLIHGGICALYSVTIIKLFIDIKFKSRFNAPVQVSGGGF